MNPDAPQFEKYWRDKIADEVDQYVYLMLDVFIWHHLQDRILEGEQHTRWGARRKYIVTDMMARDVARVVRDERR